MTLSNIPPINRSLNEDSKNKVREHLLAFSVFLILVILLFAPALFRQDTIILGGDEQASFYHYRAFGFDSLKKGHIPMWNPYIYSGTPYLAGFMAGLLYLPNVIFLFLSYPLATNIVIVLHFLFAGFFIYLLCRYFKISLWPAVLAGIIYMLNGKIMGPLYAGHFMWIEQYAWIPLIFLLWHKALDRKSLRFCIWAGMASGIQFLAGQSQLWYYTLLVLIIYFFYVLWQDRKMVRSVREFLSRMLQPIIFLSFTVMTSAVVLFPLLEMSKEGLRSQGLPLIDAQSMSFPPWHLLMLLVPAFFGKSNAGTYWGPSSFEELYFYIGMVPLLLLLYAVIFSRKQPMVRFFIWLTLSFLLVGMGRYLPFYTIFYHILPLFNRFRAPTRLLYISVFGMSILSAFGMESLLGNISFHKRKERHIFIWILVLLVLSLAVVTVAVGWQKQRIYDFLQQSVSQMYNQGHGTVYPLSYYMNRLKHFFDTTPAALGTALIFLTLGIILIFYRLYRYKRISGWIMAAIGITLADLLINNAGLIPIKSLNVLAPSRVARFYEKNPGMYRILAPPDLFPVNEGMVYHIYSCTGYDPVGHLSNYERYFQAAQNSHQGYSSNLWRLMNLKFIFSRAALDKPSLKLVDKRVDKGGAYFIYENRLYLPRAMLLNEVIYAESNDSILDIIDSPDFEPDKTVVLQKSDDLGIKNSEGDFEKDLSIEEYSIDRIKIKLYTSQPGVLFLSENYYSGWKAFLDGRRVKIYRANYTFQAVKVPVGKHTVTFICQPASFLIGSVISIMAIVIFGLSVLLKFTGVPKKREDLA